MCYFSLGFAALVSHNEDPNSLNRDAENGRAFVATVPGPHNPRCYFNDRQTPFYGPSCVKWTDKRYNPSEYFTFRNARSRGVVEIYRTLNSRMRRERGVPSAAARFGPRHLVSGGAGRSTSHKLLTALEMDTGGVSSAGNNVVPLLDY